MAQIVCRYLISTDWGNLFINVTFVHFMYVMYYSSGQYPMTFIKLSLSTFINHYSGINIITLFFNNNNNLFKVTAQFLSVQELAALAASLPLLSCVSSLDMKEWWTSWEPPANYDWTGILDCINIHDTHWLKISNDLNQLEKLLTYLDTMKISVF